MDIVDKIQSLATTACPDIMVFVFIETGDIGCLNVEDRRGRAHILGHCAAPVFDDKYAVLCSTQENVTFIRANSRIDGQFGAKRAKVVTGIRKSACAVVVPRNAFHADNK